MNKDEKKHSLLEHIVEDTSTFPSPQEPDSKETQTHRNQAFIRYMAFLFGVAFIFVVISLIINQNNSRPTISELNQNANTALARAEKLQEDYQAMVEENQALRTQVQELKDALEEAQERSAEDAAQKEAALAALEAEKEALLQERNQSSQQLLLVQQAYELLCKAENAFRLDRLEDCKGPMEKLADSKTLLGQEATALYETILAALEAERSN